jgi:hypothetical protein
LFLINNENVPGRRSKGSGAWAGMFNLYDCVDPRAGKLGVVFTNLLPFLDPTVLGLFNKVGGVCLCGVKRGRGVENVLLLMIVMPCIRVLEI